MSLRFRWFVPLFLGLALVLPAAAPATAATVDNAGEAETLMLKLVNGERTKRGLRPLRIDTRLGKIARERSGYQAQTDTGSHTHSGGRTVFDLIESANIKWYAAGEIIAQNRFYPTLRDSAEIAIDGWLGSPTHRAILLSDKYNYIGLGFGMNADSERRYWTGVFMRGPDRTKPWAATGSVSKKSAGSTKVTVTLRWSGGDRKLQVLTSGLRYYEIQRRRSDRAWRSWGTTTSTSKKVTWKRGKTFKFRVRSRDKAGHWGAWHKVTIRT